MLRRPAPLLTALTLATLLLLAARPLQHPAPASAAPDQKQQGAELFATRGCTHCHGDDGQGTDRAPTLHNLRKKFPANRVHDQIVHGGQGMPAFGDALQPPEVDALVAFLRNKRWITPPQPPTTPAAPAPQTPAPADTKPEA